MTTTTWTKADRWMADRAVADVLSGVRLVRALIDRVMIFSADFESYLPLPELEAAWDALSRRSILASMAVSRFVDVGEVVPDDLFAACRTLTSMKHELTEHTWCMRDAVGRYEWSRLVEGRPVEYAAY